MILTPLLLAVIVTSSPIPISEDREAATSDTSVEAHWNQEQEEENSVDYPLEVTNDNKRKSFSRKKLASSSEALIFQQAPPTKHPIERKTIKAALGYVLGFTAFYCGTHAGVLLATSLDLSFGATAAIGITLGLIAGTITIHYVWNSINTWFSD